MTACEVPCHVCPRSYVVATFALSLHQVGGAARIDLGPYEVRADSLALCEVAARGEALDRLRRGRGPRGAIVVRAVSSSLRCA